MVEVDRIFVGYRQSTIKQKGRKLESLRFLPFSSFEFFRALDQFGQGYTHFLFLVDEIIQ